MKYIQCPNLMNLSRGLNLAKNRFQLSAGLNLEKVIQFLVEPTIFEPRLKIKPLLYFFFNSASVGEVKMCVTLLERLCNIEAPQFLIFMYMYIYIYIHVQVHVHVQV